MRGCGFKSHLGWTFLDNHGFMYPYCKFLMRILYINTTETINRELPVSNEQNCQISNVASLLLRPWFYPDLFQSEVKLSECFIMVFMSVVVFMEQSVDADDISSLSTQCMEMISSSILVMFFNKKIALHHKLLKFVVAIL